MRAVLVIGTLISLTIASPSTDRIKRQTSSYPKYFKTLVERVDVCYGQISSPDFPAQYPNGAAEYYIIRAPADNVLSIKIELMDVESSTSCVNDYVAIYDGKDASSPLLARLCGRKVDAAQTEFTGTSRQMFVSFVSNSNNVNGAGFILQFSAVPNSNAVEQCQPPPALLEACSNGNTQFIRAASGIVTSPNYPGDYPDQTTCRYAIDVSEFGNSINVDWTAFSLESSSNCIYDTVTTYEPGSNTELGPYCGRNGPADTVTVGPVYYITLFADFAVVSSGFRVVFNALGTPVVVTTPGPTGPTTEPPTTTTTTPGSTTEPPTTTTTTPAPTTPAVIRTCSFEASDDCDWIEMTTVPGAGSLFTTDSGPTADYRTGRKPAGVIGANTGTVYAVMKAADNGRTVEAGMFVKSYGGSSTRCLTMWYTMSDRKARLRLVVDGLQVAAPPRQARGGWDEQRITINNMNSQSEIYLLARTGRGSGDIAVDDLTITNGPC